MKRNRTSNEQPLKEVFENLLKIYRIEDKYHAAELEAMYKELMGPAVAKQTKQVYFNKGILSITLNSAVLKNELSYGRDKIRKLLNDKMGTEIIREVRIF